MDKKQHLGRLALFVTTIIWGTSFVILKDTLDSMPPLFILALRFSGAAVLMLLIGIRDLKTLDKDAVRGGVIIGVCLFLAYVVQTYGLYYTTPGKNAFLTATSCVLVPFLAWIIIKKRPDRFNVIAALLCIAGIGLISLDAGFPINIGDVLTVFCGLFYGLHIIATDRFANGRSAVMMSMLQFAVAGILSWISVLIFEPFPTSIPSGAVFNILYLCIVCTGVCFLLQTIGQKYTPPSQAAIIMTLESVFGSLISVVAGYENVTFQLVLGFIIVFVSIIISETKLKFLRNRKTI